MQRGSQSEPIDVEMGYHLEEMICDLGQESFQQVHAPMFDTLEKSMLAYTYLRLFLYFLLYDIGFLEIW